MTSRELLVPSELRQLRSQLSDALEASDGAISDEFDSRTRNEIRAEIARKSAALIHQARHGNWNAAALREALASWRLLKRLEENARPGGPVRAPSATAAQILSGEEASGFLPSR